MTPGTESGSARRAASSALLAMGLACVVLLPLLGHNRLTDWDEGVYAGISRAMLTGTWLVPHWNGQPWLEKPPLELWLTAISFRLFGVSEFSARLVSALSGVALVGVLHGWLALRRDRLAAWLSSVFLLGSFGFLHAARVGEMDILLALGCCLALIGLAEVPANGRAWYLFWAGFAVALMTKGAASVTLLLTLVLAVALQPGLRRRMRGDFCLGLALFLVLVLPWHVYMLHRFGNLFGAQYVGFHVLARATTQLEGHLTHWWFYLGVLLVSAAPFVLLYPVAVVDSFRRAELRPLRVFSLFSLVTLVLFSMVQTRLPHYVAPMYPAIAVLTGVWVAGWLRSRKPAAPGGAWGLGLPFKAIATALALYLASAFLTAGPRKKLHSPRLPNGVVVPDNREQAALLKQVFRNPSAGIAAVSGPLLSWRSGSYNPIPTTVFYSNRQVQQVRLGPLAETTPRDKYANDPIPLDEAVSTQPRLILLDHALLPTLPDGLTFSPIANSTTLTLGTIVKTAR